MPGLLSRIRASLGGAPTLPSTDISPSTVRSRLRTVVAEHLAVDEDQLWPASSFTDDLGADSLDLVELAIAVETEFGIIIPEATLEHLRTYTDLTEATVALA